MLHEVLKTSKISFLHVTLIEVGLFALNNCFSTRMPIIIIARWKQDHSFGLLTIRKQLWMLGHKSNMIKTFSFCNYIIFNFILNKETNNFGNQHIYFIISIKRIWWQILLNHKLGPVFFIFVIILSETQIK